MFFLTIVLLILLIIIGIFELLLKISRNTMNSSKETTNQKWLNGPPRIPFFGGGIHLLWIALTRSLNETLVELCQRYGQVTGLFGSRTNYFVAVRGAEEAKHWLRNENFQGKFPQSSWDSLIYRKSNLGILHSFGTTTKELRSRSIAKLRKYGYGNSNNFEDLVLKLVDNLIINWDNEATKGTEGCIEVNKYTFIQEMSDMIWTILIGSPFPGTKSEFKWIIDEADKSLNLNVKWFVLLYAYKYLRFIPGLTAYNQTMKWFRKSEQIIKATIAERRTKGKYMENPTNFMDSFLLDIDNKVHPDVTDEQLVWIINDIHLVAVTGLASNALQWSLLFLITNADALDKLTKEIHLVIGSSRSPSLQDRSRLPYLESVILETIRLGNVVNYAMRSNTHDFEFDGYFIPKETLVMVDTECLRKDPQVWTDPHIFRPERFYHQPTNSIVNLDKLNAFGFKRPCMGEQLLRQSMFLFLGLIFQKFQINLSPKSQNCLTEPMSGIISRPHPFFIELKRRTSKN